MLDPVANTLDLRQPFDKDRADRVLAAVRATGVDIADVAYFDDMLHEDPAIRRKKDDFMMSTMDAAELLGVPAVCGLRRTRPDEVDGPEPDRVREHASSRC